VQRHGNVEVECIVVQHTHYEKHNNQSHIIPFEHSASKQKDKYLSKRGKINYFIGILGFFRPNLCSKMKPLIDMKMN
jgi:hypothetical protein